MVLAWFQANSVSLQSADQNLNSVAAIYDSLQMYIQSLHEQFDHFEAHGKDLSAVKTIRLISARGYADEIVETTESDDLEEDENDDPDNAAICSNIEF